jgi:hypothetical protein
MWASWFFTGGSYSSYTQLRNTTPNPVGVRITWRTQAGVVAGSAALIIPSNGIVYYDARTMAPSAISGSVEVAHEGGPQALVGAQRTISVPAGLSYDAVLRQRSR